MLSIYEFLFFFQLQHAKRLVCVHFQLAGFFAVIWSISVLSFLFSHHIHIPMFANPLCLVGFLVVYLLNPLRIFHFRARRWLLRVLVSFVCIMSFGSLLHTVLHRLDWSTCLRFIQLLTPHSFYSVILSVALLNCVVNTSF